MSPMPTCLRTNSSHYIFSPAVQGGLPPGIDHGAPLPARLEAWEKHDRYRCDGRPGFASHRLCDVSRGLGRLYGGSPPRPSSQRGILRRAPQRREREKVDVDHAFISMVKFKNGAVGSIEASRFCAGRKNYARVEVHGTEGFSTVRHGDAKRVTGLFDADEPDRRGFKPILVTEKVHPFYDRWWPQGHVLGWEHAMVNMTHHFFDAIANDKGVEPWGGDLLRWVGSGPDHRCNVQIGRERSMGHASDL
jgi:hypothetical protein